MESLFKQEDDNMKTSIHQTFDNEPVEEQEAEDQLEQFTPELLKSRFDDGATKLEAMWEKGDQLLMVTVTAFKSGWATIEDSDGNEHKVRAKELYQTESQEARNMSGTLKKYRERYVPSVANSGKKSLHCGDSVAEALEYQALEDLYEVAGQILEDWTAADLRAKYQHLNLGSQRMNVGNRIRAAYKRGDEAVVAWVEDNTGEKE